MAGSRISQLSSIIAENTAIIEDCCTRNKIPCPSFAENDPPMVMVPLGEPSVSAARDNVIAATRELSQLMQGPASIGIDVGIATHVPVGGDISFEDLSEKCQMNVFDLRRIIRFAVENGVFKESSPGRVSHTSFSRSLTESELVRCGAAFTYDEVFPAAARAVDALQMYPNSEEPTQSGWGVINKAEKPLFEELHWHYPARYHNATVAMDAWNSRIPAAPLISNYPWDTVGIVVDIGGGHGLVSQSIAQNFSKPKFIVQDLGGVIAEGPNKLPPELKSRISFMEHDMFQEQPVKDADVYFFRSVFHDWPDKYCVKILKALVPALKPGAKVVINDACMPSPGTLPPTPSRSKRMWDLNMMMLFNARDREEGEWKSLFNRANTSFEFLGVRQPSKDVDGLSPTFLFSIIEAVWNP